MSLRWTEQDFDDWRNRKGAHAEPSLSEVRSVKKAARTLESRSEAVRSETISLANLVPGRKPRGEMNGLEAAFAQILKYRKQAGELTWWAYEPFRIRLADGAFFRPDFVTVDKEGRTAIYECKGLMREAARVRLRVAAEKLPYPFYLVRKHKGELRVTPV
jgi:hypothetical protein